MKNQIKSQYYFGYWFFIWKNYFLINKFYLFIILEISDDKDNDDDNVLKTDIFIFRKILKKEEKGIIMIW